MEEGVWSKNHIRGSDGGGIDGGDGATSVDSGGFSLHAHIYFLTYSFSHMVFAQSLFLYCTNKDKEARRVSLNKKPETSTLDFVVKFISMPRPKRIESIELLICMLDSGGGSGRGGGRGRGGMKGGSKIVMEPHRHEGVFVAKGKKDALVTKNWVPGEAVYNENCISVKNEDGTKIEYRMWNPFRFKLAAAILGGVDDIWIMKHPPLHLMPARGSVPRNQKRTPHT